MKFLFIIMCIHFIHFTISSDIDSYEINRIKFTPLQDAIIYNDIADIMNEVEDNMKPQLNTHIFSGSASEEDIENLLSEYLHYLDKAHMQRNIYDEKTKRKNKVPLLRFEKYSKLKPSSRNTYDTRNNYINNLKYLESSVFSPFSAFFPHNLIGTAQKPKFQDTKTQQDYEIVLPNSLNGKLFKNALPTFSKNIQIPVSSSCYCKTNEINCNCGCKQCFTVMDDFSKNKIKIDDKTKNMIEVFPKKTIYMSESKPHNKAIDDKLNILIKIDVQYPEIFDTPYVKEYQNHDKYTQSDETQVKEMITSINLPFPYFNFPIPLELHRTNINKHSTPLRKMTIHKKKKSHSSINTKKRTSKKNISFHSVPLNTQTDQNKIDEKKDPFKNNDTTIASNQKNESTTARINVTENIKAITDLVYNYTVPLSENANISINIINSTETTTMKTQEHSERVFKIENSIDSDFLEKNNNILAQPLRLKREEKLQHIIVKNNQSMVNGTKISKKVDKSSVGEIELLYWPTESKNQTLARSENITALILERESRKAKLNMSNNLLRKNRTTALERAIFGDVDWNDVDSVAPVFMSFVGKYIRGILTFCSNSICHSMKCADKECTHRSCTPDNRYNHKGHCYGSNITDSLAGMESIMDLPSNIAFEIVDILQDKMLGKMFGKATLCITSKCITFIASKKTFQSLKCISKELSPSGHCLSVKKP